MQGINSIYFDLGYVHTIADSLSFRQEKPQNLSQNWYKSSTHIENCAGAVAREGLVLEIPILTPEYLTSVALVQSFLPTHSLLCRSEYLFILHQSVVQNVSDICHAPLSRSSRRCFCMLQKSRGSHQKP